MGDDPASISDEDREQLVFDGSQGHGLTRREYLAPGEIDAQSAKVKRELLVLRGSALRVSTRDPEASQQFAHRKGLGDVVVGPGVQHGDFVSILVPGGQNDDWGARELAKLLGHVDSVAIRKTEIEQDDVWIVHPRVRNSLTPGASFGKRVAVWCQRRAKQPSHLHLVVDEQHLLELAAS